MIPSPPADTSPPAAESNTWLATKALGKASLGLLNPKIWMLSALPLLLAGGLWGILAYFTWEPMNDVLRVMISGITVPYWVPDWVPSRSIWIPLALLLVTVPGVMVTAIVMVSVLGTGVVARHVAAQYGIQAQAQSPLARGAGIAASVWHSAWVLLVLGALWLLSLPAWLIPGLGLIVPLMLLGWANSRLFSRDVLADFASSQERDALIRQHRNTLWGLGLISSVPAFIPAFLWLGGAILTVVLPVMALLATWLYVMIFLASSLLFSHYLMPALKAQRERDAALLKNAEHAHSERQARLDATAITATMVETPSSQSGAAGVLAKVASPQLPQSPQSPESSQAPQTSQSSMRPEPSNTHDPSTHPTLQAPAVKPSNGALV